MAKPKEPCTHPVVYAIGKGKLKCTRCGKILEKGAEDDSRKNQETGVQTTKHR